MSAEKRYYVPAKGRPHPHVKAARIFEVIDRQNDRAVYDSAFQSQAILQCRKLNIGEAAIPGGFNQRRK